MKSTLFVIPLLAVVFITGDSQAQAVIGKSTNGDVGKYVKDYELTHRQNPPRDFPIDISLTKMKYDSTTVDSLLSSLDPLIRYARAKHFDRVILTITARKSLHIDRIIDLNPVNQLQP